MLFRLNKLFSRSKKSTSLWKKISKKKRQNIKAVENKSLVPHSLKGDSYPNENLLKIIYINFIYLSIIYLHHQTNKIDFCLQNIQKNPLLAQAFQLSYNEFRAKFYNLLIISTDQGENFSLALSRQAEFFSALTHFFEILPLPFSALGGIIRIGINEINKRHKANESKKLLNYCVTDENFTKVVSLLFSYILVKNLPETENLDLSVKKNFSIFWDILKEQTEKFENNPNFSKNIEKIWAYCFYLFELTAFCSPKLEFEQKNSIKKSSQPYETNFFDPKKFLTLPSLPIRQLPPVNIGRFWESKAHHETKTILSEPEMSPAPAG